VEEGRSTVSPAPRRLRGLPEQGPAVEKLSAVRSCQCRSEEIIRYLLTGALPNFDASRLASSTLLLYNDLLRQRDGGRNYETFVIGVVMFDSSFLCASSRMTIDGSRRDLAPKRFCGIGRHDRHSVGVAVRMMAGPAPRRMRRCGAPALPACHPTEVFRQRGDSNAGPKRRPRKSYRWIRRDKY